MNILSLYEFLKLQTINLPHATLIIFNIEVIVLLDLRDKKLAVHDVVSATRGRQ